MKRLLMIVLSLAIAVFSGMAVSAEEFDSFVPDEPIIEEYSYTNSASSSLYFSGNTANCSSSVYGYSGTTTGAYVTSTSATNTGGYGTSAYASFNYSTYPSSQYNFKFRGEIYNSTPYESGIAEPWGPKSLS